MATGRPPLGPRIVHHLDGDVATKERLQILLETLSGELTVPEACRKLDVSQTRFFELRTQMLQSALQGLEPKPAGRPPRIANPPDSQIEQLEHEVRELRIHLAAAQIREEIALAMPHLLERNRKAQTNKQKKTTPRTSKNAASLPIPGIKTTNSDPFTNENDAT